MARSIPEVLEAVHAGKRSLRLADQMLYLPRSKQRAELQRRRTAALAGHPQPVMQRLTQFVGSGKA